MDHRTPMMDRPTALSTTTLWERRLNSFYRWMPYASLAVSLVLAEFGFDGPTQRLIVFGLTLVAAAWTWLTFTRHGEATRIAQAALRLYFIGFVFIALLLVLREGVFLVYGLTGFFHAALLRPWPLSFVGVAAAGFVVHAHIVITEQTAASWAIYLGVVALQTAAVSGGLYVGTRIAETAEERRQMLERLELTLDENAGLHAQLVAQAREAGVLDERQRMAREIHDTIAQGLAGVITQIEAIHQSWDDEEEVRRRLDTVSELARLSLAEARRSVQAIRPAPLEESHLPDALTNVASQWSELNGLPVQVSTTGEPRSLRPEVEVTLLRAAQEGLANIGKHSAASRAGLTLSFMRDSVTLDIRDDGTGFDITGEPKSESFGLAAMRQRVEELRGVIEIESTPGEGTAISISIPTVLVGSAHA